MVQESRLNQIKSIVENYTKQDLDNKKMEFEQCNAYTISLDLSLDRSNVSRILNQLFTNNQLIKIEGRPTLFISKSVILDYYPSLEIPNIIKKNDSIQNYLHLSKDITQEDFINVIGLNPHESLYSVFQKLIPYFLNPPFETLVLLNIIGEHGTGKKYIIEELFRYAKTRKVYSNESYISYINMESSVDSKVLIQSINPNQTPIIVLENLGSSTITTLNSIIIDINFLYKNKEKNPPLVMLLSNGNESINLNELLIPTKIHIPSLSKRSKRELVELILFFILKFAKYYNLKIKMEKKHVHIFLTYDYSYNCKELFQEIYKYISKALYQFDSNDKILVLKDDHLSHHFKYVNTDDENITDIMQILPDQILIEPTMEIRDLYELCKKKIDDLFIKSAINTDPIIENLIIQESTCMNDPNISATHNDFEEKLKSTIFSKDPNLLHFIGNILYEFSKNRISILKYQVDNKITISNTTKSIYSALKYTIQSKCQFRIMESEKYLIEHIIEQSIRTITQSHTPTLIICHESGISENYARKFNELSNSRRFYSVDYSERWQSKGIKPFTDYLIKIIKTISRGSGITLFVDSSPLTTIDSRLVLNLKMSLLSFSPVSAASLYKLMNFGTEKVFSTRSYLKTQTKINTYLEQDSLIQKKERDQSLDYMKKLFPTLDIIKTNEALFKSLTIFTNEVDLPLTNRIIVDYLFQGNCILEQIRKANRLKSDEDIKDIPLLESIKKSLSTQPELCEIEFTDDEISLLYKSIYSNIVQQS